MFVYYAYQVLDVRSWVLGLEPWHPKPETLWRTVMSNRQQAIEKIEAWGRWDAGNTADKNPGMAMPRSPGFIPADQADHLTVELALQEYMGQQVRAERREEGPALRDLLVHVYGRDLLPDSFEP